MLLWPIQMLLLRLVGLEVAQPQLPCQQPKRLRNWRVSFTLLYTIYMETHTWNCQQRFSFSKRRMQMLHILLLSIQRLLQSPNPEVRQGPRDSNWSGKWDSTIQKSTKSYIVLSWWEARSKSSIRLWPSPLWFPFAAECPRQYHQMLCWPLPRLL